MKSIVFLFLAIISSLLLLSCHKAVTTQSVQEDNYSEICYAATEEDIEENIIIKTLKDWEYVGLFISTFLAATILPFSSEIMVTALLCTGANPLYVFIIATIGNWLGSVSTYYIGWLGKWEWIEKWFKVTPKKLEKQRYKISKYGSVLAFFVWLPIIGDVFALALGFYKINLYKCVLFMLIGKACRFAIYILLFDYIACLIGR